VQLATTTQAAERVAVIDLGSNSFRMVLFEKRSGSWQRELEVSRGVRVGEGLARTGQIGEAAIERALSATEEFAGRCAALGLDGSHVDAVATSAIRDADNGPELLELVRARTDLEVRVLSREQEARYAYLAAVHSTTLTDGCVLDLGGGSLQLVRVAGRLARESASWRLGAVRMTERFLADGGPAQRERIQALRVHVDRKLRRAPWLQGCGQQLVSDSEAEPSPRLGPGRRLVGLGGTVRNLAAAAQHAEGLPEAVHGFAIRCGVLDELVERLASLPARERGKVPGIKAGRADIVLAGALVVQGVMRAGGFAQLEVTGAGLREGIFFERQLAQRPLEALLAWPSTRAA
jgi:exopolyphosphatase/guanosine-5'-triphosphate,3'-diphosphate pyrophosphatase